MDIALDVFNAAKDGNLEQLKNVLEIKQQDEVNQILTQKTNGATPLIAACMNGHLNVVEFLVNECSVDIKATEAVRVNRVSYEGASPLWCAAAARRYEVLIFLIRKGADVNSTTLNNCTPLNAACGFGHFEIVKYLVQNQADIEIAFNRGTTCLMEASLRGHTNIVKYLLDKKAKVDRKCNNGDTALHKCAQSGRLDIMKVLLANDAVMEENFDGLTPLLMSAKWGQVEIVEYLIGRDDCMRENKIDALELLGATYENTVRDMMSAVTFWKQAMQERIKGKIQKTNCNVSAHGIYNLGTEACTMQELDELVLDQHVIRKQALLIQKRILGKGDRHFLNYVLSLVYNCKKEREYEQGITLCMFALDKGQNYLDVQNHYTEYHLFYFLSILFCLMMRDNEAKKPTDVAFNSLMVAFRTAVNEVEPCKQIKDDGLIFNNIHLLKLLTNIQHHMSEEYMSCFKKTAYRLVKLDLRAVDGDKPTLLHLACSKAMTIEVNDGVACSFPAVCDEVCSFPADKVVKVLLEVGADPNVTDDAGNTALHIAAMERPGCGRIIDMLLAEKAHVDTVNHQRQSALDLFDSGTVCGLQNIVLSLKCLAAQVVQKHKIPYETVITDKMSLFKFVQKH